MISQWCNQGLLFSLDSTKAPFSTAGTFPGDPLRNSVPSTAGTRAWFSSQAIVLPHKKIPAWVEVVLSGSFWVGLAALNVTDWSSRLAFSTATTNCKHSIWLVIHCVLPLWPTVIRLELQKRFYDDEIQTLWGIFAADDIQRKFEMNEKDYLKAVKDIM